MSSIGGSSHSSNPGFTFEEFKTVLDAECVTELEFFPLETAHRLWADLTSSALGAFSNPHASTTASRPLIACNRTPGQSGYARRQLVRESFPDATFGSVVYNRDDKSCYSIQCPVRGGDVLSDLPEGIKIQPMLPMMKIAKGTVDSCRSRYGDGSGTDGRPIAIVASFGPGIAEDRMRALGVWESIMGRVGNFGEEDLMACFPHSGAELIPGADGDLRLEERASNSDSAERKMSSDDMIFMGYLDGLVTMESNKKGDTIYVNVDQSKSGLSSSKILVFVAFLASQPEVTNVEIQGEIKLMGGSRAF